MIHPKIHCEHKTLNPQSVAKILCNISTSNYGFVHVDNYTAIFYDNLRFNLLCYDVPDLLNGYPIYPITYSIEWLFIQKILNQLDDTIKSHMVNILKLYPSKLLSIIDAILSFPLNYDIFCIMTTNIFTNIEKPTILCTIMHNTWRPFCIEFCKTCNYIAKFTIQEHIVKILINYFMTTKIDQNKNIVCISESFIVCILYNERSNINFTMLAFDHDSDKVYMCSVDTPPCTFYSFEAVTISPFDFKKIYDCVTIYHPNDNTYKLSKKRKNLLINGMIRSLSEKIATRTWHVGDNDFFY